MTYPVLNKLTIIDCQMKITENKSVAELKSEFNTQFPFLQIEIYKTKGDGAQMVYEPLKSHQKIKANANFPWHDIQINKEYTVKILKEYFTQMGFDILIYRKAGTVWVETTLTEAWTLERQNQEGEMLSQK